MRESDDRLIRYLLGRLSEADRADIEQRLFTEPDFLESVRTVEEELIRDALAGALSPDDQRAFDSFFLSFPDLRARYRFTKAMRDTLPQTRSTLPSGAGQASREPVAEFGRQESVPVRQPFFASRGWELLAIAACAGFLVVGVDDLYRRSDSFARRNAPQTAGIETLALTPGLTRSGGANQVRLSLPSGAAMIRLKLEVELSDHHQTYRVALRPSDSSQEALQISGLAAHPEGTFQSILLDLPASLLGENSYMITLSGQTAAGFEPVEAYSFEIVSRN